MTQGVTPRRRWLSRLPLVLGATLFAFTFTRVGVTPVIEALTRLGPAVIAIILTSAAWHILRTLAWTQSFEPPAAVSFGRLFRIRLAGEAISFLTIRGIGGEPLKIWMLQGAVGARDATASIVREKAAYFIVTLLLTAIGAFAVVQLIALPPVWITIFHSLALGALAAVVFALVAIVTRGAVLRMIVTAIDRVLGTSFARHRAYAAMLDFLDRIVGTSGTSGQGQGRERDGRLWRLGLYEALAFWCPVLETWAVLRALDAGAGAPTTGATSAIAAIAIEVFARGGNLITAAVPANLGTLEAALVAVTGALALPASVGATMAIVRRIRVLVWAGAGLLLYPRHLVAKPAAAERDTSTAVLQ